MSTSNKIDAVMDLLRLLKEAGLAAGAFGADGLFGLEFDDVQITAASLFDRLKPCVGERRSDKDLELRFRCGPLTVKSDSSSEPRRMMRGPAGAAALRPRSPLEATGSALASPDDTRAVPTDPPVELTDRLEAYFQAAMGRFLR
ncbi:hypothetical protein GQ600_23970 [Phytophthora cactorum]|nr:hypothetical protein GQ600_23970 [Phytophthora cactorum]